MRRKSERTAGKKTKSSPEMKIEKPKKSRTRRSRKQSASSDNDSAEESVARVEPVEVEPTAPKTPVKEDSPEEAQEQVWHVKPTETTEERGEIKKLKICLARPPSTPERPERSPRSKRKHSRATSSSDTPSNEGEEKKKKHRSKRSMRESRESDKTQDSQEEIDSYDAAQNTSKPVCDETPMSTTDEEVKLVSQSEADAEPEAKLSGEDPAVESTKAEVKESASEMKTSSEQESIAVDKPGTLTEEKNVSHDAEEKIDSKDSKEEETSQNAEVSKSEEDNASNKAGSSQNESVEGSNKNNVLEGKLNENEVTRKMSVDPSISKDVEELKEDDNKKIESSESTQSNLEEPITNGKSTPIVINRKRRWGSRTSKGTPQKSITISTDILKDIIPDVKPVEFEEVIEEKKHHKRVEVSEMLERPVLPKIVIDNTDQVEHNKKADRDKENIRTREPLSTNRKISIVKENDSLVTRPLSPPMHSESCILYITNLVRPFTLAQLKNLLQRTGRIVENGFWIDRIKSKCFVKYEDEEQAVETRHALHGVTWPVSNPKTLQVDFSDQDAFDRAVSNEDIDNTKASTIPGTVEDWLREQDMKRERGELEKPWERKAAMREWDLGKNDKESTDKLRRDDRTLEKRSKHSRERSPEPAKKFKKKEEDAPAKLLDDLFKKTTTTPCIYWLPLSDEMIAIKEEQRRKHMAEHERRMSELRRNRRH